MSTDRYASPLSERYASKEMQYIFSQDMKFRTWRKIVDRSGRDRERTWPSISPRSRLMNLRLMQDDINYDVAKERET